jgi:hypothetical protein
MQYVGSFGLWDEDYEKQKIQQMSPKPSYGKRKTQLSFPANTSKAAICWIFQKKVENLKVSSFSPDL